MGQTAVSQEVVSRTVTGISTLTAETMLRLFHDNPNSNLFLSAFSLSTALSMTAAGAKGKNLEEMMAALQFAQYNLKPEEIPHAFDTILQKSGIFQPNETLQLSTANHLWADKTLPLNPLYVDITQRHFHAGAEACDFAGAAEQEREKINQWAEKETNCKIKDLIPSGAINSGTAMVLTNAIYFKASWIRSFDANKTSSKKFTLLSKQEIQVPMMTEKAHLLFTQQNDFMAIEKPYKSPDGKNLSMVFVLPEQTGAAGLEAAIKALKPNRPNSPPFFMSQMFSTELTCWIPKFKIEFSFEATGLFKGLGMNLAFNGGDFSGISSHPLNISSIIHKAFVDVNEEGTEAAAATAVMMTRSIAINPHTFNANRPFIFLIWDRTSNLILFSGLVANPSH